MTIPSTLEQWLKDNDETIGGLKMTFGFDTPRDLVNHYGQLVDKEEYPDEESYEEAWDKEFEKQVKDAFNDWKRKYNKSKDPMILYRAVNLKDIAKLKKDALGVYWTDSEKSAEAYGDYANSGNTYVLKAEVPKAKIDWDFTIKNNLNPSFGEAEQEINVLPNSSIKVLDVIKDDKSLGMSFVGNVGDIGSGISKNESNEYLNETYESRQELVKIADAILKNVGRSELYSDSIVLDSLLSNIEYDGSLNDFINKTKPFHIRIVTPRNSVLSEPPKAWALYFSHDKAKYIEIYVSPKSGGTTREKEHLKSLLIHELTHAYDDFRSSGKYYKKVSSEKDFDEYLLSNHELHAFYSQAVSELDANLGWDKFRKNFINKFEEWDSLSKDVQKKLLGKLFVDFEKMKSGKNESKQIFESNSINVYHKSDLPGKIELTPEHDPDAAADGNEVEVNYRLLGADEIFYAVKDNKIVGHIGLKEDGYIETVYVSLEYRRQGIAELLHNYAVKKLGNLWVDQSSMEPGEIALFQKLKKTNPKKVSFEKGKWILKENKSILDFLNEANNILSETVQSDREIRWLADFVLDSLVRSVKRKKEFNGAVASTQQWKDSKEWNELEGFLNDWDITVIFSVAEGKENGMWVSSKKTIFLSEPEKDDGLNKSLEKFLSKNMSEETFRSQIKSSYFETIIHELTHAFDDYRSKGKYIGKKYSSDFEGKDYWLQQVEINARFGQTTKGVLDKKLSLDTGNGFEDYMNYFKKAIRKWEDMPEWVQKRLKGRMYKEYSELSNQEKDIILVNESWKTLNEFLMELYDKKDVEPPEELMWASADFRLKGDKAYTTNQLHTFSELLKDAIKNPAKYEKEMKRLVNIIESIQNVLKKNPEAEKVIKSYFKLSDKNIEDIKNANWMESVENKSNKTESIIGADVGEELKQIEKKYEEYLEDLAVFERKDSIAVSMIKIKKEYRKQGYARKIMEEILKYADKKNVLVVLTPEPQNNAISKANLEKFYRSLGFMPNKGRNKDFRYSETMIRQPKETKKSIVMKEDDSFFKKYIQFYYYNPDYSDDEELEEASQKLNKPMRGDVKKYKVFVKDPKTGNTKKVNFGDPNMEIKRDDPERRKSFRARHKCDTAKDKTTPRYWSCKFWGKKSVSDLLGEKEETLIEQPNVAQSAPIPPPGPQGINQPANPEKANQKRMQMGKKANSWLKNFGRIMPNVSRELQTGNMGQNASAFFTLLAQMPKQDWYKYYFKP